MCVSVYAKKLLLEYFIVPMVTGIMTKALNMKGKYSTSELYPQHFKYIKAMEIYSS